MASRRSKRPTRALLARLVIEQSPSGGWHVVYRCESPISGNLKLAQRRQSVDGPDEVTIAGKSLQPAPGRRRQLARALDAHRDPRRGRALSLCAPRQATNCCRAISPQLPVLTEAERELLLEAAWALESVRARAGDAADSFGNIGRRPAG